MSISPRETAEVARVNATGRRPVVLVHGLWLLAGSWKPWEQLLEERGYAALSVDWPGDRPNVEAARAEPTAVAGTTVQQATDHIAEVVAALDQPPVLIGHSFGGLLVQQLAGRGLAAGTVAIDPAPFKGVLPLPVTALRAVFPVLRNPANRNRAITLTQEQFAYGFANALSPEEAAALYDEHHVAAPARPIFQAAVANVSTSRATAVDTANPDRGPLLLINGAEDHTVPPAITRAAHRKQARNPGVTELLELDGMGHSLVIDAGWRRVADATLDFLAGNNLAANAPSPDPDGPS